MSPGSKPHLDELFSCNAYLAAKGAGMTGLANWALMPEQLVFARGCTHGEHYLAWLRVAEGVLELCNSGTLRFSSKHIHMGYLESARPRLEELVAQQILRVHYYDSGAHQYQLTPFARTWAMFVVHRVPGDGQEGPGAERL